jgi:parallel beta-helix repeat protein
MKKILTIGALILCAFARSQDTIRLVAKGDLSDETATIQKAINASMGKVLLIPNDTFVVKDLYGVSKVRIKAEAGAMFQIHNFHLESISDFSLDGLAMSGYLEKDQSTTLVQIINCKGVKVINCLVQNNWGEGIAAKFSSGCKILYNRIINTDVGVFFVGGNFGNEIAYNEIRDGRSDGVALWGVVGAPDSGNVVHHNRVYNKPKGSGSLIQYTKDCEFSNNYAENCSAGFGGDETSYSPTGLKVLNNTYRRCRVGISSPMSNSIVSGNTIDSTAEYAACIGSLLNNTAITFNNVITKNTVINATDGIRIVNCSNCTVIKNTVADTREKKITYDGIMVLFGTNNQVINNTCGTALYPILVHSASNTFLSDNVGAIAQYQAARTTMQDNSK